MGKLTTLVLDTSTGRPAPGIKISLYRINENGLIPLLTTVTNEVGEPDTPLLENSEFSSGHYQLVFETAPYFRHYNLLLDPIPLFDEIVVRIGISNHEQDFHLPLFVSPFSYSIYRSH
ncbi:hydroxyisourate hydrolase [Enterovibrio nigricans]|uniref:5-hydroxyisourate hydrolase n=1 Tax=Enterovibrio nigricans DSM 22720 TaxID=1121868 RepID=A0A1T4UY65_9GAMM|nr:hydroxyisourate hydrolase [Enterovibrio nigricans]PKF50779.1 hydroxyisourate hydrolase [Enterovibrio nigricans]SKA57669.1 5-hydroxyisourate hydrolase [Enterovibrio nigricans DSM 22720]